MTDVIFQLPDICLIPIIEKLDPPDRVNCAKICSKFSSAFVKWTSINGTIYEYDGDWDAEDKALYLQLVGKYLDTVRLRTDDVVLMELVKKFCVNLRELSIPVSFPLGKFLGGFHSLRKVHLNRRFPIAEHPEIVENFTFLLHFLPNLTSVTYSGLEFYGHWLKVLIQVRELVLLKCFHILAEHLEKCFELWVNLERIYVASELISGRVLQSMVKHCLSLSYVTCCVSHHDSYEILAELPLLKCLQIWCYDRTFRRELLRELSEKKKDQLLCLRIYNVQLKHADITLIGQITSLRELKVIFPTGSYVSSCLTNLRDLEYIQVFDYSDRLATAQVYVEDVESLLRHCPRLRYLHLCYVTNLSFRFIFHVIQTALNITRQVGPLRVYTYGTPIDRRIYAQEFYKSGKDTVVVHCQEQTRQQLNSLSMMDNCFCEVP